MPTFSLYTPKKLLKSFLKVLGFSLYPPKQKKKEKNLKFSTIEIP